LDTETLPAPGTILIGPFWPGQVRVLAAYRAGSSIRIEGVGLADSRYSDQTLTSTQFRDLVSEVRGGTYQFDAEPRLFRLATEALRTHLAHAFDPQFAVSVSQVDPLPHQIDAVYKHMLSQPRLRFLLADDPGAGKTIMAGLLMRELMQRGEVRRVLVLCPKALTDQWRREMWERFRQRFVLVTGEVVAGAFGQNAWTENNFVVASIDLVTREHILPGLEQSNWDLIIFDEAHKLSAYRYANKIDKTQRYQLAESLSKRTKHLLLMTATPHRGDDENFRLLMSLLDEKVFASREGMKKALDKDQESPFFLRRMKEAMRGFDGKPLFLPRNVDTVPYPLDPDEQALYDAVTDYVAHGLEQAESAKNRNVSLAMTVLQRRLASSLFAITRSLERRRDRLTEELAKARRLGTRAVSQQAFDIDVDEDEDLSDLTDEEEAELSGASTARTPEELETEIAQLNSLVAQAQTVRTERKLREFEDVIRSETVRDASEKILVFTEHKDTLTHITRKLREWGHSVCNIHGGMKLQDRIAAEKDFRGDTQFLVATDAAGEGINLQFCRVMVNWDLPWNPNRLEQRMGRIHRYGQEFEVNVYNLVAQTTREGEVLIRLMSKLKAMKRTLGHDQVYDVIAGVLDSGQVRLDVLIREAILGRRSKDDILAEFDFLDSESSKAAAREALAEALATPFIDMAFINGELRDSKERRLTPEFVERFFADALKYLDGRLSPGTNHDWRIDFVPAGLRRRIVASNTGEFGAENRLITFRKERLRKDPPAEFVAPGHPLFDAVMDRLLDVGRPALATGTAFIDKEAREPYLVWLIEASVANGAQEVVHKRLLALRQRGPSTGSGQVHFEAVAPGVLLDLPPSDTAPAIPASLSQAADANQAIAAATEFYAEEYLAEVTVEQDRQVEIVRQAIEQSFQDSITDLQARLERQQVDEAKGKDMRLAIQTTNSLIDAQTRELKERRELLGRRRATVIQTPRVVGVAAVIPGPVPHVMETAGNLGGDMSALDKAAMDHVMQWERDHARQPEDVHKTGVGYDIKSTGPDGDVRYIEVKGHNTTGDVLLYFTEWQTAHRMRGEFYIYEVNHVLTAPQLRIIQDPVGKGIQPVERVVEYLIRAEQLDGVAEPAV
jgi:superfamily II DNA or RNA helicase